MGTFPASFRSASQKVHDDHEALSQELAELDTALEELAHSAGAERICRRIRLLSQVVPEHFGREEEELLAVVEKVSPELKVFAGEMKRQHQAICKLLVDFCFAAEELRQARNGEASIDKVKGKGKLLAQELSNHVALEEDQLAGFL